MKLVLKNKKQETKDVMSFIFKSNTPIKWLAGQYLFYTFPHPSPDERGVTRYFTISSTPHERNIMITTRFSDEHPSSFKQKLFNAPLGTEIGATDPDGDFTMEDSPSTAKAHIFLSGGIGITPYRSILLDLDHGNLPINITLLYANSDENFVFKEELEKLAGKHQGLKIKYFISPKHIEKADIEQAIKEIGDDPIIWFSGPEKMTEAFEKMLKEDMKIPEKRLKFDYFPGYEVIN